MTDKFKVNRAVLIDRMYAEGETYQGSASHVSRLVEKGILSPAATKAEPAPKNKAEPKPLNKAS